MLLKIIVTLPLTLSLSLFPSFDKKLSKFETAIFDYIRKFSINADKKSIFLLPVLQRSKMEF